MSLYASWKIIEKFIIAESRKKIKIIRKSGFHEITEIISKDCLLKAYGGELDEPDVRFPPSHWNKSHQHISIDPFNQSEVSSQYFSPRSVVSDNEKINDYNENDETRGTHKSTFDFEFNYKKSKGMDVIEESSISEYSDLHDDFRREVMLNNKGGCCNCRIF